MKTTAVEGIRFALDLPSSHEPRRFKVRPVAEADRGAVHELLRHAPGVKRDKPPQSASALASLCFGAFDEMRVLRALLELGIDTPQRDACTVELLLVEPRYRRAGLGAGMFTSLARGLKDAGAHRIFLEVDHDNPQAARFWRRLGFVETKSATRQGFSILL